MNDAHFMGEALALARQAAQAGEVPVGAVVVRDGAIVGRGCNAPIAAHDPTAHAEVLALRQAAATLGNYRLDGCTLYVTLEPCAMCAQAMLHARLGRVVYGAAEPKTGAAGSVLDLFGLPQLNHHTTVQGGVCAEEAGALLQAFFAGRRAQARLQAVPLREDALRTPEATFGAVWQTVPEWAGHRRWFSEGAGLQGLRLHLLDLPPANGMAAVSVSPAPVPAPVVLALHDVHGWWPQWLDWARQRQSEGWRVLLPDLVGFGQSDKPKKPGWHSVARHANVLADVLHHLGLDGGAQPVPPLHVAAPPQMQPLAAAVTAALAQRQPLADAVLQRPVPVISVNPVAPAALPPHWRDLPYPDAGHRAGLKAWPWPARP